MLNFIPGLAGLLGALATWLAGWVSKKVALIGVFIGLSVALFVAFAGSIAALAIGIEKSIPAWAQPGLMLIPDNVGVCISALMTAKIARMVYLYHKDHLRLAALAS